MGRRPARVTQADIARAIRAARQEGAGEVVIDTDGRIRIPVKDASESVSVPVESDEMPVF
jgi:hypothetical protein